MCIRDRASTVSAAVIEHLPKVAPTLCQTLPQMRSAKPHRFGAGMIANGTQAVYAKQMASQPPALQSSPQSGLTAYGTPASGGLLWGMDFTPEGPRDATPASPRVEGAFRWLHFSLADNGTRQWICLLYPSRCV